MKAKPIIFSCEMVKAILAGNKTQTRRVMKPQLEYMTGRAGGKDIGDPIYKGKKMNYHKKPETEAERKQILDMNYKQCEETVNIVKKITCICGDKLEPFFMYRCYFCGLWLCSKCAKLHFGERGIV